MNNGVLKIKELITKLLILALIVSVGLIGLPSDISAQNSTEQSEDKLEAFFEVYDLLSEYHLSGIDQESLIQAAIDGMIDATEDPYTDYFSNEDMNNFEESIDGSFVGIGIIVSALIESEDDIQTKSDIMIEEVLKDSPAEKAGLKVNDKIVEVDNTSLNGMGIEEVQSLILGEEGTIVSIKVQRDTRALSFNINREHIQLPSVEAEMLTKDIGYIRLYTFSIESIEEFNNNLQQLQNQGMKKLILDLRGNPGGYLDAAVEIASNFIEQGPIAIMSDREGNEEELTVIDGTDWKQPMAVLIDQDSASASEILAGALRDYEKATIIGQTSYGKGTVQSLIPINAGGYLKMTIDHYLTPSRKVIDGVGVEPDIEVSYIFDQIPTAVYTLTEEDLFVAVEGIEWIQQCGKEFIVLRPTIEFFGGDVEWNATNKIVEVKLDNDKQEYIKIDKKDLIVKNETTYIALDRFKHYFPVLEINKNKDKKFVTIIHP